MNKADTSALATSKDNDKQSSEIFPQLKSEVPEDKDSKVHLLKPGIICDTEARGYSTPQNSSPEKIVVDASEGFIPLGAENTILRWRFRERSFNKLENSTEVKEGIEKLFGEALLAWDDASPVKFTKDEDVWDFEILLRTADECNVHGCVLASAFFPDAGRHELVLYPKLFDQSRKEQIDTFIHEIGHIFGLRHFFAKIRENRWPSEVFGTHDKFTIMNYGSLSELTEHDKNDLKQLYNLVWSNVLTEINGTPIRMVKPYHVAASEPANLF